MTPVCKDCGNPMERQRIYPGGKTYWHCDHCFAMRLAEAALYGDDEPEDEYDPYNDEDAEHDIRFYDLMTADETPEQVDAYLRAHGYDPAALVKRMQQRFKLTMLESPYNPEKFYFRQEWVNALHED